MIQTQVAIGFSFCFHHYVHAYAPTELVLGPRLRGASRADLREAGLTGLV
jgi:hypothetical protein